MEKLHRPEPTHLDTICHEALVALAFRTYRATLPTKKTAQEVGQLWLLFEQERKSWSINDVAYLRHVFAARIAEIEGTHDNLAFITGLV